MSRQMANASERRFYNLLNRHTVHATLNVLSGRNTVRSFVCLFVANSSVTVLIQLERNYIILNDTIIMFL